MTDDIRAIHDHVLSLLEVSGARSILDLGCGRGEHLRALGAAVPESTRLVGIDASEAAVEAARSATAGDPRFTFLVHDMTEGIPFDDGAFDRILSVNVLEAIPDKAALLREVHRVLKPEGRLVFAHFDWDSQLYDGIDKALVRRMIHAFADWKQKWMADADGWMGRRLWRVFQETGLFTGTVDAVVHTSTRFEPGHYGWERCRDFEAMVRHGIIAAEVYRSFARALEELAARDQYFYAITLFSYVGTRADR
ncbi:MAG TPA: methyltransferase domain-containing protein [Longimicrobiales bacterium]